MPLLEQALLGILPALVVAVVGFGGAWGPRGREAGRCSRLRALAGAGAWAGGFFAAYVALQGLPPFPPVTGVEALAWSVVALAAVSLFPAPGRAAMLVSAAAAAVVMAWMSHRLWGGAWTTPGEAVVWIAVAAAAACLVELGVAGAGRRAGRVFPPVLVTVITGAGALVLSLGGSALLGQLCGALATVGGVAVAAACWNPAFALGREAVRVVAITFVALLAAGFWFAETDPWALLATAAAAPAGVVVAEVFPGPRSPKGRSTLGLGAAAAFCAAGVARAAALTSGY